MPAITSPSRSSASEIAKCGTPCRKLVVPSSGSTIQRLRPSPLISPPSSPRKPYSGRVRSSSLRSVRSAMMSARLTKSPGPFSETWSCSTSPKSRFSSFAAAKAARIITVMVAERGASDLRSGGPERSRPMMSGPRPTRATGGRLEGGRAIGLRSVLGTFHVAAILGVDHQLGADPDMRRHHHADPAFDDGGLVGRRGGLALDHGIGLGDGQHHRLGKLDADRRSLIERDLDFHAVLQPARLVGIEQVGADGELLVILLVHEGEAVVVLEQESAIALVDMDVLDGLAGAEALLQLVALAQRLGLDGDEGAALARADVLHLGGHPELAVVLDDVAGADGIDRNFHGRTARSMNGIRPRTQERERPARACIKARKGRQPAGQWPIGSPIPAA